MEEDDRVRRDDIPLQAAEYSRKHRSRRRWYKLVTCLAAVVVFCTVYALILPAVTMEGTACGPAAGVLRGKPGAAYAFPRVLR